MAAKHPDRKIPRPASRPLETLTKIAAQNLDGYFFKLYLLSRTVVREKIPLFKGGPVELDRLFMIHRLGIVIDGSLEILPGIYTGGDSDQIRDYIASGGETDGLMRFFIGYSGWGAGQLTKEILENSWAVNVHPDTSGLLRGEGESYWRRQVEELGPEFRSWLSIPAHPSLN